MATSSITNSTVSLDLAKLVKSQLKSSGQIGGCLTVVQPYCNEEIEENLEDSKFTGIVRRKQFRGKQVCKSAEEQLCEETEPMSKDTEDILCKETEKLVCKGTKEPLCKESGKSVCKETDEPVCKQTEVSLSKETVEIVCKETGERLCKETEEPVSKETEKIVCKETDEAVCKEPDKTVWKETEDPVCKETEEPVCRETEEPVCKETEEPVCKETEAPVWKETEEPVWKETVKPVYKESEAPVSKETEEIVCKETEEPVCKETEKPVGKETDKPVGKETEVPVCKETEEPVRKEREEMVCKETEEPEWKETEEPVYKESEAPVSKETEEIVCKETEEPVCKETEKPVGKETEAPVYKETKESVFKETKEPVAKEAGEPMSKEQDIDYCVSGTVTVTEPEITDESENDNESSTFKGVDVRSTGNVENVKYIRNTDVSQISRSSNIEESESTKIACDDNVSSKIPIQKSESVEQKAAILNSCNLDTETDLSEIIYSSDDCELEDTEVDSDFLVASSVYEKPRFEDFESSNKSIASYIAGAEIDSNSHGDVDGALSTRACLKEQYDPEKIGLLVADIVAKTKVAYKVYNGCTWNPYIQVVFVFVFTLLQSTDSDNPQTEGTIVKQAYALLNQSFSGLGEQFVFVATFHYLFDLPEPNLPGVVRAYIWNFTNYALGVDIRPVHTDASHTREHEELGDSLLTPPDSGVFSSLHDHTEVTSNRYQETHPLHGSPEQNRTGFISIQSSPLTVTIREANESMYGITHTRIEDVPELQAPSRDQLGLNLDQTDLKARRVDENLTNIFQDGNPTTIGNRRPEVETAGSHVQEDNSISRMASQLSTSVSSQPSRLSGDSSAIAQQERMTESDVQARANTFDRRWCHSHLKPDKMAEAGFVYTGKGDATRCFKCNIVLVQWEKDDDPLVEHIRNSPECEYIQNQLLDNPQNFGASNTNGAAQENNAVFDEQNGTYGSVLEEGKTDYSVFVISLQLKADVRNCDHSLSRIRLSPPTNQHLLRKIFLKCLANVT